jgi:hypothetical protein
LPAGAGPLLAASEPLQLPGATAGPATTTASAEEPGLLDRLVDSILGGGSDGGGSGEGAPAQKQPPKKPERTTR